MNVSHLVKMYGENMPILKEDLKKTMHIKNEHSFNQVLSYLVSFGIFKRYENGIFYIPSANSKFSHLKPSVHDVVEAKYLKHGQGIRTGAYLLYKYKFTSQVSAYYEVLTNNTSVHTRSKKLYDGQVVISYPPLKIDEENIHYLELLELIKHIQFSDFDLNKNRSMLMELISTLNLNKEKLSQYYNYYNGRRYHKFRTFVKEILGHEIAS